MEGDGFTNTKHRFSCSVYAHCWLIVYSILTIFWEWLMTFFFIKEIPIITKGTWNKQYKSWHLRLNHNHFLSERYFWSILTPVCSTQIPTHAHLTFPSVDKVHFGIMSCFTFTDAHFALHCLWPADKDVVFYTSWTTYKGCAQHSLSVTICCLELDEKMPQPFYFKHSHWITLICLRKQLVMPRFKTGVNPARCE